MEQKTLYEKVYDKLSNNICELIDKEPMSASDLDTLGKAIDVLKDISTITAMDSYEYEDDRSSMSYPIRTRMTYPADRTQPMRDRYHRSGHSINDRMIAAMEQMYDNAGSEHERAKIDNAIQMLRNM